MMLFPLRATAWYDCVVTYVFKQGSHSHGKAWKIILSWKMGKKVMEIENIVKSNGISLLLITNHAREVTIIPYLWAYCSDLDMGGFRFMFSSTNRNARQEENISLTPHFQFEKRLDFLFICVIHVMIFCVCLPGILENSVNCQGNVMEFYYVISVGTLFKVSLVSCSCLRATSSQQDLKRPSLGH